MHREFYFPASRGAFVSKMKPEEFHNGRIVVSQLFPRHQPDPGCPHLHERFWSERCFPCTRTAGAPSPADSSVEMRTSGRKALLTPASAPGAAALPRSQPPAAQAIQKRAGNPRSSLTLGPENRIPGRTGSPRRSLAHSPCTRSGPGPPERRHRLPDTIRDGQCPSGAPKVQTQPQRRQPPANQASWPPGFLSGPLIAKKEDTNPSR